MDYLSQEEDMQFFDAKEEEMMMMMAFDFGVWNGSPGSVVERRRKFLQWMGVQEDLAQPKFESGGASESCVEAEQRSGGFSSSSSQASSSGSGSSLVEVSEELSPRVDGCDVTRRQSSSMASSSGSRCCQVKETEKQSNIKKGWFTRLRSFGCSADTKLRASSSSSSYGDVLSRVKVKHCKKQTKELSALYQSQDIKAHNGSISTMKFSGDGKYLASSGEDGIVRVWKVIEVKRSRLNERDPSCMYYEVNDLSQLKPVLLDEEKPNKTTGSFKKTSDSACVVFPPIAFRIMEKPLHEFRGHTGEVLDISWSKDNCLLSASMDKTVRLWQVGSNDCLGVFPHNSYVTSVQFNPVNENYFMSGSVDGKVRIWNISGCNVVDWADLRDIISAVCYRPDGKGGIIGSLTGSCRFFNMSGDYIELDSQTRLLSKKKSSNKRITGFQFLPQDPRKVLVVSADSKVRVLQGNDVVRKYKGVCKTRSLTSASLTSDGKHVVSACEDSNVYIWSNGEESVSSFSSQTKKIRSFERFSTNASVAATWCGFSDHNATLPFSSPSCLSVNEGFIPGSIPKGSATWPEENLPANPLSSSPMSVSHYKFLKSSYQRATNSSLAWGMVIVTGGWDGRIRTFQNYGLPVTTT
ncbi:hypothetical protein Bca52824_022048 [Brassica carinata]|uniref:Uncharacterized protein n=1 Tax=Brassica carinata TaxID=52824 RepID=A0A8X7VFW7_BRACI|nr:hypothetical protein Bca52824_022048 [Brassica carinata]